MDAALVEAQRRDYVTSIARNAALVKKAKLVKALAAMAHEEGSRKVPAFDACPARLQSWHRRFRRMIVKPGIPGGAKTRAMSTSDWKARRNCCVAGYVLHPLKHGEAVLYLDVGKNLYANESPVS